MSLTSLHLPALPAGLAWGRAVREFFAYHGIWAVGVRLLRKLSIDTKVLLVLALVAAPLLPLTWYLVDTQNTLVSETRQRLVGLRLAGAITALRVELGAASTAEEAGIPVPPDRRAEADAATVQAYEEARAAGLPVQRAWERSRASVVQATQSSGLAGATQRENTAQAQLALEALRDVVLSAASVDATSDAKLHRSAALALDVLPTLQLSLTRLRRTVHNQLVTGVKRSDEQRHQDLVAAGRGRGRHDVA
jgi:hypothetical protein